MSIWVTDQQILFEVYGFQKWRKRRYRHVYFPQTWNPGWMSCPGLANLIYTFHAGKCSSLLVFPLSSPPIAIKCFILSRTMSPEAVSQKHNTQTHTHHTQGKKSLVLQFLFLGDINSFWMTHVDRFSLWTCIAYIEECKLTACLKFRCVTNFHWTKLP